LDFGFKRGGQRSVQKSEIPNPKSETNPNYQKKKILKSSIPDNNTQGQESPVYGKRPIKRDFQGD